MDTVDLAKAATTIISAFFEGGIWTGIIKLVLSLSGGLVVWGIIHWIKGLQIAASEAQNSASKTGEQAAIGGENKKISDDAKQAGQDLRDALRPK